MEEFAPIGNPIPMETGKIEILAKLLGISNGLLYINPTYLKIQKYLYLLLKITFNIF